MVRINAVIFDLDNVLFDEKDYIVAAYRKIASFLSKFCDGSEAQIYNKLVQDLQTKTSMYPRLFNDAIADFGLEQTLLPKILEIYSTIDCKINLYPEVKKELQSLRRKKIKLGLVTNGTVKTQKNKVRILGLEDYFDVIIFARELGKANEKPNPEAYRIALERLCVTPEDTICVGDNPHTDFWGAKKLGMRTVRLLSGEFKDVKLDKDHEADEKVSNFNEVNRIINQDS